MVFNVVDAIDAFVIAALAGRAVFGAAEVDGFAVEAGGVGVVGLLVNPLPLGLVLHGVFGLLW